MLCLSSQSFNSVFSVCVVVFGLNVDLNLNSNPDLTSNLQPRKPNTDPDSQSPFVTVTAHSLIYLLIVL
ncbi:hypothetical protein DL95DRAFT_386246, partial [Leptodontidium sp. 2 PMI_412]